MSSLGSANASAQVAAALKSAASDCPRNGLEVIVHPRFRRQLEEELSLIHISEPTRPY